MESIQGKRLILIALLFAIVSYTLRAEQISNKPSVEARDENDASLKKVKLPEGTKGGAGGGGGRGGVYGGGGCGWGWGGPGGSSGGGGGGGGAGYWSCQCTKHSSKGGKHYMVEKRDSGSEEYKMREFGECTTRGRCRGMRLDCPLHCGGPCLYDCSHTCKAYCKR